MRPPRLNEVNRTDSTRRWISTSHITVHLACSHRSSIKHSISHLTLFSYSCFLFPLGDQLYNWKHTHTCFQSTVLIIRNKKVSELISANYLFWDEILQTQQADATAVCKIWYYATPDRSWNLIFHPENYFFKLMSEIARNFDGSITPSSSHFFTALSLWNDAY